MFLTLCTFLAGGVATAIGQQLFNAALPALQKLQKSEKIPTVEVTPEQVIESNEPKPTWRRNRNGGYTATLN